MVDINNIVDNTGDSPTKPYNWSNPSDKSQLLGNTSSGSTPFGNLGSNINKTWGDIKGGNILGTVSDVAAIKNNPFGHPFGSNSDGTPAHPSEDHPMFSPNSGMLNAPDSNGISTLSAAGQSFIQGGASSPQAPKIDQATEDTPSGAGTAAFRQSQPISPSTVAALL